MKSKWIILLLLPVCACAQKKEEKPVMHFITSVGSVAGEVGARPLFGFSGGVQIHNYFTGIGVAYDRYKYSSFPVFADLRFYFKENTPVFLYVNGGYNFPGKYHKEQLPAETSDKMSGGIYMDAGFGYRLPIGKMNRLILSTGYSQKRMMRRVVYTYPCYYPNCDEVETIYAYQYHLNRLVTKLSWELGR